VGQIDVETFITIAGGIIVFFIGLIISLVSIIYRLYSKRDEERWHKHDKDHEEHEGYIATKVDAQLRERIQKIIEFDAEKWKLYEIEKREISEKQDRRIDVVMDGFRTVMQDKIESIHVEMEKLENLFRDERSFVNGEIDKTERLFKELFESRKELCTAITEISARCDERHKK
jgi:hypothetical protein